MPRRCPKMLAVCAVVPLLAGCGWFGGGKDESSDAEPPMDVSQTAPVEVVPDQPEARLELNLELGQRFPLIKTVEQTLAQATPEGPVTSHSRLQLLLAIEVEELHADGRKRLGVRYHRVRYSHDVAGERIDYDSGTARDPLPEGVQAYHGLVDNGFSFWIGPDNHVVELVGFDGFLKRCLRDVPAERKNAVLAELEATQGEEGIANFVDDSIGLLPYDASRKGRESIVKVGHQWTRTKQMVRPVPIYATTKYTLKKLNEEIAEVDVVGSIAPSTTFGPSGQSAEEVQVAVRNGHTFGTCTLRRATGLPIESHVERFFDMTVRLPGGETFEQRKRIVTTIATFQEQPAPEASPPNEPVVVPAGAERPSGVESPVVPADFQTPR